MDKIVENEGHELPEDYELVLELSTDAETDERVWGYYFVDHANVTLFWLEQVDPEEITNGVEVMSEAHIRTSCLLCFLCAVIEVAVQTTNYNRYTTGIGKPFPATGRSPPNSVTN